jgi:hypothetical protein
MLYLLVLEEILSLLRRTTRAEIDSEALVSGPVNDTERDARSRPDARPALPTAMDVGSRWPARISLWSARRWGAGMRSVPAR